MIASGQRILGYTLQNVIGDGGMATIYRATNSLDLQKAIKILKPQYASDPQIRQRFNQEAKIMVSLGQHTPNICQVENIDITDNYVALVMEYLDGQNLADYLDKQGAISPEQLNEWLNPVLQAIEYAHKQGVVHRDIKPSNLFLTISGQVKVLDFGIAKVLTSGLDLTKTRQVIGSPSFMSPEQIQTPKKVDHRSDIYALGVTMWTLLAGQSPYQEDDETSSEFAVLTKIVHEPLPPLIGQAAILNPVIQKATAKSVVDRFQTCQELADALPKLHKVAPVDDEETLIKDNPSPDLIGTEVNIDLELTNKELVNRTGKLLTYSRQAKCKICGGTGSLRRKHCSNCNGMGIKKESTQFTFTIPPAKTYGDQIKVADKGNYPIRGGEKGRYGNLAITLMPDTTPPPSPFGQSLIWSIVILLAGLGLIWAFWPMPNPVKPKPITINVKAVHQRAKKDLEGEVKYFDTYSTRMDSIIQYGNLGTDEKAAYRIEAVQTLLANVDELIKLNEKENACKIISKVLTFDPSNSSALQLKEKNCPQ